MSFTTSISRSTILGASPRDISSTIRSFGRAIRPRPIATICCSPPESVRASRFSLSLRAGKYSSTLRTSVSMSPSRRAYAPSRKFFSTDIVSKSRRPWGTCAIPALTMASGRAFVISRPENAMLPALARTSPLSVPSKVDLPAPFAPTRAMSSPRAISMSISNRTGPAAKPAVRPFTRRSCSAAT